MNHHDSLAAILQQLIRPDICEPGTYQDFIDRLEQGSLTRDQNPQSHFCVYFLPYNPDSDQLFFIHHKKSGLWLSPGGHIDPGELPLQTVTREAKEELNLDLIESDISPPFLLSLTQIEKPKNCLYHYDIWYYFKTSVTEFSLKADELREGRWFSFHQAKSFITEPHNLAAIQRLHHLITRTPN